MFASSIQLGFKKSYQPLKNFLEKKLFLKKSIPLLEKKIKKNKKKFFGEGVKIFLFIPKMSSTSSSQKITQQQLQQTYNAMCALTDPFPDVPEYVKKTEPFNFRTLEDFSQLEVTEGVKPDDLWDITYALKNGERGYLFVNPKTKEIDTHEVQKNATPEKIKEEKERILARHFLNVNFLKNAKVNKEVDGLTAKTIAKALALKTPEFKEIQEEKFAEIAKKEELKREREELKGMNGIKKLREWKEETHAQRLAKERREQEQREKAEQKAQEKAEQKQREERKSNERLLKKTSIKIRKMRLDLDILMEDEKVLMEKLSS